MVSDVRPAALGRLAHLACMLALVPAIVLAEERVYYSTDEFTVTDFDLRMYLRKAPPAADGQRGTRARNLQALSDLYALRLLADDAEQESLLTAREAAWIAEYAVSMEKIERYIKLKTDRMMSETDWQLESRTEYIAHPERYRSAENVTVRTLLLKTDDRTEAEAIAYAQSLVTRALSFSEFEALVRDVTEDTVARDNGGLMENVQKGQTVRSFEEAAFSLTTPGEISAPVVSRFGVHLIQLVQHEPSVAKPFDEVEEEIVAMLQKKRRAQYIESIQQEARERQPEGFVQHTDALDALVDETTDGRLGQ